MKSARERTVSVAIVAVLFLAWAGVFIYKSSFISIDGERNFCLFDDAMISMRYAWNLSHGDGLVWNPGERVEGFTNMLMTLVMSVFTYAFSKGGAVLAVQLLGAFFMLAIGFFTMKVGEAVISKDGLECNWLLSALFFAGGLVYYPLCYWSLMGMETGLLSVLALASVRSVLRADGQGRYDPIVAVLPGLAFWTRPDAAVFIALVLAFRFVSVKTKIFLLELSIIAGFVAAISVFRFLYYGSLVPNTYVLKMEGLSLAFRLENGLGFISSFLEAAALPLVLALISVVLKPSRYAILLFAVVLASIGYQIYVGGDPWQYWRLLAPFIPLLFVLVLRATVIFTRSIWNNQKFVHAIIVCVLFVNAWLINDTFEGEIVFKTRPYQVEFNHATVSAAIALSRVTTKEASVGVLWAGSIPYYTGLKAYDFLGRADRHIASLPPDISGSTAMRGMKSLPGHNKYDLEYSIFELEPTYIQKARWGRDNVLEKVKKNYVGVWYKGVPLTFKKDSPFVKWDQIAKGSKPSPYAGPLPGGRTSLIP